MTIYYNKFETIVKGDKNKINSSTSTGPETGALSDHFSLNSSYIMVFSCSNFGFAKVSCLVTTFSNSGDSAKTPNIHWNQDKIIRIPVTTIYCILQYAV